MSAVEFCDGCDWLDLNLGRGLHGNCSRLDITLPNLGDRRLVLLADIKSGMMESSLVGRNVNDGANDEIYFPNTLGGISIRLWI